MNKKTITVLAIGILVLGAAFASGTSKSVVEVQISPFSVQKIMFRNTAEYDSKYGFGLRVGYLYNYEQYLYAGADLSCSNYKYEKEQNRYLVLGLMGKIGFFLDFDGAFKTDFALKAGVDLRKWADTAKFYPTVAVYLGGQYAVNEKIAVTLGADFKAASQQNKNIAYNSLDLAINCYTGISINL